MTAILLPKGNVLICSVCGQKAEAKGLCKKHYDRLRRTGDAKSPDKCQTWNLDVVRKRMYHNAKRRALQKALPFTLQASDIKIPEFCPVLGIKLETGIGKFTDNSPSIDRIRPECGYVPDNIRVISWRANRIKNDSTIQELEAILRYVKS